MNHDVLIIGGGPAGLSAAINLRARGRQALVISNPLEENPLWRAGKVDNYLGFPGATGAELLTAFRRHAEESGASFVTGRALTAMRLEEVWSVGVESEVYSARAVILAAGVLRGRKYPGEAELLGRGVSYCATCDGMFYRGKAVAVLGWTDTAREEAAFLEGIGCAVTYFHQPKDCAVLGETRVEAVLCDGQTVQADAVFLLRPTVAPADLFPGLAAEDGLVAADRRMATNLPGLFAAGDCTGGPLQISKAVGDGLIAGQSAAAYLSALEKQKA